MKAKVKAKPTDLAGLYYGSMGCGMKWNPIQLDLSKLNKEPNGLIFGTLGKGRHMRIFKKEEFKPELAPTKAAIEHLTIDGKDYVKMCY